MYKIISRQLIFVLFALTAITYFNCDDSGIVNSTNTQFCISGKLADWIPGDKILYANILGHGKYIKPECTVDNAGNFNLCLPDLADSMLYAEDSVFIGSCPHQYVVFNPNDARGNQIFNFRVKQNESIVGAVAYDSYKGFHDSIKVGDFEAEYIYANKQVTMSGYSNCANGDTSFFNGTASKGWNKVIKHYTRIGTNNKSVLYDLNEPPGGVWRYHGD
ncbi:MAG: hypothetical protein EHM58_16785 [Ignavibacteriae bacterium]|nr:MAG: hypothetical protein EHM58_16785 [Ignavibacteriota bacterium]